MKVVQILGPSYSGSTVLGYILNTKNGWFFGSEVYRLLYDHVSMVKGGKKANPKCDFCAGSCLYWSESLKQKIINNKVNALSEVYDFFEKNNPGVEVFVDGSKGLRWYDNTNPDFSIVTVKHPIRLIASFLYNERKKCGFSGESLVEYREYMKNNSEWFVKRCVFIINNLIKTYQEMFVRFPSAFVCKMDQLHLNDFSEIRSLENFLSLSSGDLDMASFSRYEVHPLGGNRAPYWQVMHSKGKTESFGERDSYYTKAESYGDYKIDNKYSSLMPSELLRIVSELPEYQKLTQLLGYELFVEMG